MRYYFNTPAQINGDRAYNARDFTKALSHYKKGLHKLKQVAAKDTFKPDHTFYDELASVLNSIVVAQADAIRSMIAQNFDYAEVETQLNEIPDFLNEMMIGYKEIESLPRRSTKSQDILIAYKAAAMCYEEISDTLMDSMATETGSNPADENTALCALKCLKQAINYLEAAQLQVDSSKHIGCLGIMEKAYKINPSNKQMLEDMSAYIDDHALFDRELEPMEILEIKSYLLLIAIEKKNRGRAVEIHEQCLKLMTDSVGIDQGSYLLEDLGQLFKKIPSIASAASEFPSGLPSMFQSLLEVAELEINAERVKKKTELAEIVGNPSAQAQKHVSFALAKSNPAPTFFSPVVARATAAMVPQNNEAEVFMRVIKDLASHYQDPKFLANILSMIGDFYYVTKSFPFKNIPLIAYELYENTLCLDPAHDVAKARMGQIYHSSRMNARIIKTHKHLANPIAPPSSSLPLLSFFNNAIEEHVLQIETLSLTSSDKLGQVFNDLIEFMAKNMVEKSIAGRKSHAIADDLLKRFRTTDEVQASSAMEL